MPEKTCEFDAVKENDTMKDNNGGNFKSNGETVQSKLISEQSQKSQLNDIKCAEIKTIPSVLNGCCERQRNVFKIGEYNRATASFEIKSLPAEVTISKIADNGSRESHGMKADFDLPSEIAPNHYFKSNFARSMVINNASKCKSLDCTVLNGNGCLTADERSRQTRKTSRKEEFYFETREREDAVWETPGKENWDLRKAQAAEIRDDLSRSGSLASDHHSRNKKADVFEENLGGQSLPLERSGSRASSMYRRSGSGYGDRRFDEALFRSPLTASCRSSCHRSYSSTSDVDAVLLQSQVTTLQWQLRQAEASRQMHRAVLEQVVAFLHRTHKNLDQFQSKILDGDAGKVNRVPRSRSVHGVDSSPSRLPSPRSESNLSFQKAKSVAQIADPFCPKHGSAYRDMTWRRPRKQQYDLDEMTPSKLSEEAFRLLRTVQSLLNTREPDLSSRLPGTACSSPGNAAEISSASSTVSAALDSDNSDNFQSQETLRNPTPIRAEGGRLAANASGRNGGDSHGDKNPPLHLSLSSADDESGFSSLNSFQDIGVPVCNSTANGLPKPCHPDTRKAQTDEEIIDLHEVGLPGMEDIMCKIHRRWSSARVDDHVAKIRPSSLINGEILRVLWV